MTMFLKLRPVRTFTRAKVKRADVHQFHSGALTCTYQDARLGFSNIAVFFGFVRFPFLFQASREIALHTPVSAQRPTSGRTSLRLPANSSTPAVAAHRQRSCNDCVHPIERSVCSPVCQAASRELATRLTAQRSTRRSRPGIPLCRLTSFDPHSVSYNVYVTFFWKTRSMAQPAMPSTTVNYQYSGKFDTEIFKVEFTKKFQKNGHYNAAAIPDMVVLLDMIENDPKITDIRWTAYMLATAFKETCSPTLRQYPLLKMGKPVIDKATGKPAMRNTYPWLMQMRPVDEVGKGEGRQYHEAAKVKLLVDGRVQITEQDGDKFLV
jgi:hypothetical protein